MFKFLLGDPVKKLQKLYAAKLEKAVHAQRNGKIELYSQLSVEAEAILQKINEAKNNKD